MPTTDPKTPAPTSTGHSSFATRRADRAAREAAGEDLTPSPRRGGFRAGYDADNPTLVVRHVQS